MKTDKKTTADKMVKSTPLTAVTVNIVGGNLVLASATGDYEIDTVHGVIHANVFPPTVVSNGGPNMTDRYALRATAGGSPIAFVGLHFIGVTSTGTYKFSFNMQRLDDIPVPAEGTHAAAATPITNLRIAQQRPSKLAATAATGTYLHATGFASQVLANDPANVPGEHLIIGNLYSIAASGMPTTMNLQLDHFVPVHPTGTIAVFYEVRADFDASSSSGQ